MNNLYRQKLGKKGEEIASRYLSSKGFRIIEKNFRKKYSEVDIVGIDDKTLVFVEVKTRIGTKFGIPEDAITSWKIRSLIRSAQYYKLLNPHLPDSMRIDVVTVFFKSEQEIQSIGWYKNITL